MRTQAFPKTLNFNRKTSFDFNWFGYYK